MSSIVLRCSLGDLEVSGMVLRSMARGNWIATLKIGWPEAPPDLDACSLRVTRKDGEEDVHTGHVRRSRIVEGTEDLSVTIAGGAGKLLDPPLLARYHAAGTSTVPVGLVLASIAADAGESLADGVETELDAIPLQAWARLAGTGRAAIDTLAGVLVLGWRFEASGDLWMGAETWPELDEETLARGYFESGDPSDGSVYYVTDGLPFRGGQSVNGARAIEVCYHYDAMAKDRRAGYLRAEVRTQLPGDPVYAPDLSAYARPYVGTVRAQDATTGLLDIACDDTLLGDGLRGIPLRIGLPGCKVTVPEGTRLRVLFESADPRRCYAKGIDQDESATKALALLDDDIDCGSIVSITDSVMGACTIVYSPGPASGGIAQLRGKITGPGHAYVKGKPA